MTAETMNTKQQQDQELFDKLAAVEEALTNSAPNLQVHMAKLHAHLRKQPELVHILTDEQIAVTVGAYMRLTNSAVSQITVTKAKAGSKKSFSAADLGLDLG